MSAEGQVHSENNRKVVKRGSLSHTFEELQRGIIEIVTFRKPSGLQSDWGLVSEGATRESTN